MAFENVFSWSKSRAEQFGECRRKYFYDKYASWGGWDAASARATRSAYVLKNLKNRFAWKGETVHHTIEGILKSLRKDQPIPFEEARDHLTKVMRADWRSSKAKKNWEDPKRNLGLFEHEYEKPVSDATWKKVHDEALECLRNFYHSGLYQELLDDKKENWLLIEDLEDFTLDGAKIFVKLDFARKKDGVAEIYDWKTGKSDKEASLQIGAYAMYAMQKWGIPLERIRAYLFNLSFELPQPEPQVLTTALLDQTRALIAQSVGEMKDLLSDPERNIPKAPEDFAYTEDERRCSYCNFYKICGKYAV